MRKRIGKAVLAAALAGALIAAQPAAAMASSYVFSVGGESDELFAVSAPQADLVALDDLNISVMVPRSENGTGYTEIEEDSDGFVYIRTMEAGSLPYVIVGQYDYSGDASSFANMFSTYMSRNYRDLDIDELNEGYKVNGVSFVRVVYRYGIQGYAALDTRLFVSMMNRIYMFGSKEVPQLNYSCPEGFLDAIAVSAAGRAGGYSDYTLHVDASHSLTGQTLQAAGVVDGAGETAVGSSVGGTVAGIEEEEDEEVTTIDFTESLVSYKGTWVAFADGFKIYLPSDWNEFTLTDTQRQQGTLYMAGDTSGAANAPYIRVAYAASTGIADIEGLSAQLEAAGYTVNSIYSFSGIEGVLYTGESENVTGVMFFRPGDTNYIFAISGAPSDENAELIAEILISLMPNA